MYKYVKGVCLVTHDILTTKIHAMQSSKITTVEVVNKVCTCKKDKLKKFSANLIDVELLRFLRMFAKKLVKQFEIKNYKDIALMHPKDEEYGTCWGYCRDKYIVIDIKKGRAFMAIEEIVDTLIHELAHLDDEDDEIVLSEDGIKNHHNIGWQKRYERYYKWLKKDLIKQEKNRLVPKELRD